MTWLLAKIWISVGGAALLGLLIGWAWRGLGLKGKAHRAMAERDLAINDRDQLRTEVDQLHAARREENRAPAPANGGMLPDPRQMKSEIELRDQRLKALTDELARSKEELETLKTKPKAEPVAATTATSAAAPVSMTTGAALGVVAGGAAASAARPGRDIEAELGNIQKQRDDLAWRNRYLESRVALLEQNVTKPVDPDAPVAEPPPEGGEKAQMIAQLEAMKTEVDGLKKELEEAKSGAESNRPGAAAHDTEKDQELARLRWRNRYLESRLDYLEGSKTPEPAMDDPAPEPQAAEAEPEEPETVESETTETELTETPPAPEAPAEVEEEEAAAEVDAPSAETEEPAPEPEPIPEPVAEPEAVAAPETVEEPAPEPVLEATPEDAGEPEAEAEPAPVEADVEPPPVEAGEEESEADTPAAPDVQTEDAPTEDAPTEDTPAESAPAPDAAVEDAPVEGAPVESAGPLLLDAPRDGQADSLQAVDGIGPLIEQVLNGLGVYHLDQVAAWTESDAEWINAQLGFPGRVQRENWIGKAKALVAG